MNEVILDVRERDEFAAEHVQNSINTPLSNFRSVVPHIFSQLDTQKITLLCRSGNRAKLALDQIQQLGYTDKIQAQIYEGGILEWKRQGKPTVVFKQNHLPIMRQVQLIAGLLVLTSTILGAFVNSWYLTISAVVGTGLTIAGSTGFCGIAILLSKMRRKTAINKKCRDEKSNDV